MERISRGRGEKEKNTRILSLTQAKEQLLDRSGILPCTALTLISASSHGTARVYFQVVSIPVRPPSISHPPR